MKGSRGNWVATLVIERVFAHPPAKLWRALTENPLIAQWMMNNDFEPVIGRKFQFRADTMPNWNGVVDCEVLIVDPLQRLAYCSFPWPPARLKEWVYAGFIITLVSVE